MSVRMELWEGDPLLDNLGRGKREGEGMLVGGLGWRLRRVEGISLRGRLLK